MCIFFYIAHWAGLLNFKGHWRLSISNLLTYLMIFILQHKTDAFFPNLIRISFVGLEMTLYTHFVQHRPSKAIIILCPGIFNFLFELIQAHHFCFDSMAAEWMNVFFLYGILSFLWIDFIIKFINIMFRIFCLMNNLLVPT